MKTRMERVREHLILSGWSEQELLGVTDEELLTRLNGTLFYDQIQLGLAWEDFINSLKASLPKWILNKLKPAK
jgi:hypothetical protein